MAELRDMLNERKPEDKTIEEWSVEINAITGSDAKISAPALYSYLNGNRNITGRGAKALAVYFYRRGDLEVVRAISEVALGVPYPVANAA